MARRHSTNGQLIPAVAYLRRSSEKQEASIPTQKAAIERYAKEHGYQIIRWYTDDAISGDATNKRFGFQRMIADAEKGEFKAIVCWDQDRFGRFDSIEAGKWIFPLREAGVHLATVAQGKIDWNDFAGRMIYGIQQEAKHQYLRDLARNSLRGKLAKAKQGLWVHGARPLGYALADGRLILGDAGDIALVQRIFRDYLAGRSLRAIASTLNAEGIKPSRCAKRWGETSVRTILTNKAYTGDFYWNQRSQGKYCCVRDDRIEGADQRVDERFNLDADMVFIPNNHPAIIDRATFNAVQQRLQSRKPGAGISTPKPDGGPFVLTGILFCGQCGCAMTGSTPCGDTRLAYRCSGHTHKGASFCQLNRVRQDDVLGEVIGAIELQVMNPKVVQRLREKLHQKAKRDGGKASASTLRRQLTTVERKLENAKRRLVEVDRDMLAVVQEQIRDLRHQHQQLQAALKAAQTPQKQRLADVDAKVDEAMKLFSRLRETLQQADTVQLREVLRHAVKRVEVWTRSEPRGRKKLWFLERGTIQLNSEKLCTVSP